ncbi:MAG: ribbon-helix-helix protein, CopG family [Solirubrobacterales bacterium]|nr:ribbon-helix-helix protein, CopG family [Solirubrobacterales bacterium]
MRTTITLDDEVAAAVWRLRKERGSGVSAAINDLARRGLAAEAHATPRFEQETSAIGLRIDVDNVAEALEQLDD